MLPTPSTSHVDANRVYEPAEDSFLFLDTLSSPAETRFLTERFSQKPDAADNNVAAASPLLVEVGTGSGVVLAFLTAHAQQIFRRADVVTIGSDINQFACQASYSTVQQACQEADRDATAADHSQCSGFLMAMLNADLTSSLRPGVVDVLIFNPPYVPSSSVPRCADGEATEIEIAKRTSFDNDSHLLSLSYEGGIDGMEVTNRFLKQLPDVLNRERGVAYVLLCRQNKPEEVMQSIRGWGPTWVVDIVGRSGRKAGWEKLCVIRIQRISNNSTLM